MGDFWTEILGEKLKDKPINQAWEDLSKEASFRPIIYIGIGGFGRYVIGKIKTEIETLIPEQSIRDGFAFIGLDTHPRDPNNVLTDSEYADLSLSMSSPNDVAKDPHYSNYLGWFRELAGKWEVPRIVAANMVRAAGRFGFLYPPNLDPFYAKLQAALSKIRDFREKFATKDYPKVYVISSLAGGTGSGIFLDLFIILTQFLNSELQANFLLQTILATPDALKGEADRTVYPIIYANAYSALKEMFHFILGNKETISYGIAGTGFDKLNITTKHMPNTIFLVTDSNTDGKPIIKNFPELGEIVKSYLLFEIQTPLQIEEGRPKVQDGENPSIDAIGHGEMPRAFSSIGVMRFGLPYDQVEELFSFAIARKAVTEELSGIYDKSDLDMWVVNNGLSEVGSNQLQENIRKDGQGHIIRVPLDVEGDLRDIKRTELRNACTTLCNKKIRSLEEQIKPILVKNSSRLLEESKKSLQADLEAIVNGKSIGTTMTFLRGITETIKKHCEELSKELNENNIKLTNADRKVKQAIETVTQAAGSSIFGRKGRIQSAVTSFGGDLESCLNQQVIVWSQEEGIKLYKSFLSFCDDLISRWKGIENTLKARLAFIDNRLGDLVLEINGTADINKRGPGNRFSIVDFTAVQSLYRTFFSEETETSLSLRARKFWRDTNIIYAIMMKDMEWITKAQGGILDEVKNRLQGLDIIKVINKFYPEGRIRDELMTSIIVLSSPLFPLDQSKKEKQYKTDRVIAINPKIRRDFNDLFIRYIPSEEGISYAYFSTPYEVIIYTITHGYTCHSLTKINNYKADYDMLQGNYEKMFAKGQPHRPIHAWTGASEWEELIPKPPGEEEAQKWFIVGRAFSYLFPTATTEDGKPDEKKNQAFIFNKGNNYYLILETGGKPEKIGNSLEIAVSNFEDNPEWQKRVKEMVNARIEELGKTKIRERIENEYIPIIDSEIEASGRENERIKFLRELRKAISKFIERDLRERKV